MNLSNTVIEGKDALTTFTGCKKPCESIGYKMIPLANWNMKNNRVPGAQGKNSKHLQCSHKTLEQG